MTHLTATQKTQLLPLVLQPVLLQDKNINVLPGLFHRQKLEFGYLKLLWDLSLCVHFVFHIHALVLYIMCILSLCFTRSSVLHK